jgi:hypothetical protein
MSAPNDRRAFLAALATAPLVPAALAQVAPNPPQPPSPSPSASPDADAPGPMAMALAEAARLRFGAYYEVGDREEVEKGIHANLQAAERLRKVKLANADEPVTTFAAQPWGPTLAEQPQPRRRPR